MDPREVARRLAANAAVFRALLEGVDARQARWKPVREKWSMLEVISHLADEEREDFRQRLDLTLHRSGEPWPPIDPEGWVAERAYGSRDLRSTLDDFLAERARSVEWLRGLGEMDESATYQHPSGPITAGALMHSWLAHDLIHIRQLTRLHYEYLRDAVGEDSVRYAGDW